ncbi:hypothetical protein M406DRAFT_337034 [Cryphonectria parasitica EP155]|uniref:Uncharacterized protein n=1 Tax=Cryphonectria parasitica (strain ATCC 38755 / EP155) TaxID=660469 RepID=A0A9P4Y8U1_CRYP1|nr:uncharacterized protein M406DRAFT_337034 [Cryphonectria parasitica EP155]KAF3768638.1 hypothetical protein M406DRAFT_337034 [Cryphonectria parasitica EP155]
MTFYKGFVLWWDGARKRNFCPRTRDRILWVIKASAEAAVETCTGVRRIEHAGKCTRQQKDETSNLAPVGLRDIVRAVIMTCLKIPGATIILVVVCPDVDEKNLCVVCGVRQPPIE